MEPTCSRCMHASLCSIVWACRRQAALHSGLLTCFFPPNPVAVYPCQHVSSIHVSSSGVFPLANIGTILGLQGCVTWDNLLTTSVLVPPKSHFSLWRPSQMFVSFDRPFYWLTERGLCLGRYLFLPDCPIGLAPLVRRNALLCD